MLRFCETSLCGILIRPWPGAYRLSHHPVSNQLSYDLIPGILIDSVRSFDLPRYSTSLDIEGFYSGVNKVDLINSLCLTSWARHILISWLRIIYLFGAVNKIRIFDSLFFSVLSYVIACWPEGFLSSSPGISWLFQILRLGFSRERLAEKQADVRMFATWWRCEVGQPLCHLDYISTIGFLGCHF